MEAVLQHGTSSRAETADAALASSGSFKLLDSCCFVLDLAIYRQRPNKLRSCLTLRLVFPSVQENSSAMAVLPQFIAVCGRKLDAVATVLERFRIPHTPNKTTKRHDQSLHYSFLGGCTTSCLPLARRS